jgi:hypothetical protein
MIMQMNTKVFECAIGVIKLGRLRRDSIRISNCNSGFFWGFYSNSGVGIFIGWIPLGNEGMYAFKL